MRVIAGLSKGKKLQTLEGQDVRPTISRIKESIFNIIQFEIQSRKFLDLFSGSGQMGIEALSRGAKSVTFVDSRVQSIEIIKQNLKSTGLPENFNIVNADALDFLDSTNEKFDIAYLDPPYKVGILQKAMCKLVDVMSYNGIIICESPVDEKLDKKIGSYILIKTYNYGKISINVFKNKDVVD